MVSVLAFYSDDPSLNPAEVYNFCVVEKDENNLKEAEVGLLTIMISCRCFFLKWANPGLLTCLFLFFSHYNFYNTNSKSKDGVLGI